jgi:acyl-[acyl-carrier-protein]-phospholipid O-acyltransferase/long-chain-fatty-acid--[acyl-carrier-protein] ligase
LHAAGLPNLFIPDGNSFLEVAELPTLGSGKLNIRQIKSVAETAFAI